MILECNCDHKSQDKMHGWKRRVHNPMKKKSGSSAQEWRCTVCGKTRVGPSAEEK